MSDTDPTVESLRLSAEAAVNALTGALRRGGLTTSSTSRIEDAWEEADDALRVYLRALRRWQESRAEVDEEDGYQSRRELDELLGQRGLR